MNAVWSRPPTGRVARLDDLGDLGEKVSEGAGECLFVCKLISHPGWLYKAFRLPTSADSVNRLDRLIGLPGQMSAHDKSVVDRHTAWPSVRVVKSANQTSGVLLPMAPEAYKYEMALPGGRSQQKYLEVDVLALSGTRQRQMGLPSQTLADRFSVCASIAAMADLLERHGLVYLDWSYANIFWRPADHSAYLIDLDGTSFGPRPQIQSPQWDDPHVPLGTTAGNSSDRYRVALLITTCLTGKRVYEARARTELRELLKETAEVEQLAELLIMALTAAASSRPTIARLKTALDAVTGVPPAGRSGGQRGSTAVPKRGGVTVWEPIAGRGSTKANPSGTAARATRPAGPKPPATVAGTTGIFPPRPGPPVGHRTAGRGGTSNGAGTRIQQASRSQPPASPPSSGAGTVVKTVFAIIAVVIICIILANL